MGKIVTGGTELTIGTIADGQYLKRTGTEIVSAAVSSSGGGGIVYDTQANRPAAGTQGREFVPTDGYGPTRQIDSGAAWLNLYNGFQCSNPPAYDSFGQIRFSISNSGTAAIAADGDGVILTQSGNNSTSARDNSAAVVAIPGAGAYTLTVGMQYQLSNIPHTWGGVCLTDGNSGTPKIVMFGFYQADTSTSNKMSLFYEASPTSATSRTDILQPINTDSSIFLRIYDDRTTNLTFSYSWDGRHYITAWVVGRTAQLTPSHVGINLGQLGSNANGGYAVPITRTRSYIKVFHWSLG